MPDFLDALALAQLTQGASIQRLIGVNPKYGNKPYLLHHLLHSSAPVYVRLNTRAEPGLSLIDLVTAEILAQTDGTPDVIVLDDCDDAEGQALTALLHMLLRETAARIVIFSRAIPAPLIEDPALRAATLFIPVDDQLMFTDYGSMSGTELLLEVHALGVGSASLNGRPLNTWDGALPRALFFYLVDRGLATRGDIFQRFWPKMTAREATNVFHVTKRKINEVLGTDLTVFWSGYYRIAPEVQIVYDVTRFTQLVQESEVAAPAQAEALLRRALSLYHGPFLSGSPMPWVEVRQGEIAQTYGEALAALATLVEDRGDKDEALLYYLKAAAALPLREDFAVQCMRLYADAGRLTDALRVYERLTSVLLAILRIEPALNLRHMADTLRERARIADV